MKVAAEQGAKVAVGQGGTDKVSKCVPLLEKINVHCVEFGHSMSLLELIGARVDGVEGKLTDHMAAKEKQNKKPLQEMVQLGHDCDASKRHCGRASSAVSIVACFSLGGCGGVELFVVMCFTSGLRCLPHGRGGSQVVGRPPWQETRLASVAVSHTL